MFDAALIQQCADPGIEIAIVERFIAEAGSDNPLAVSITSGNRIILPEQPRNADDALGLIQRFVGQASVRVGITQYPAGYGVSNAAEISVDIVDACTNISMGTALFGKVYRIVAAGEGAVAATVFDEAVAAWKTGRYGVDYVFGMPDPGPVAEPELGEADQAPGGGSAPAFEEDAPGTGRETTSPDEPSDPNNAGIRVDLSRICARRSPQTLFERPVGDANGTPCAVAFRPNVSTKRGCSFQNLDRPRWQILVMRQWQLLGVTSLRRRSAFEARSANSCHSAADPNVAVRMPPDPPSKRSFELRENSCFSIRQPSKRQRIGVPGQPQSADWAISRRN